MKVTRIDHFEQPNNLLLVRNRFFAPSSVQQLPMLLRPGSVGDGGAEEPGEHEQLSAVGRRGTRARRGWVGRVACVGTRARLAKYGGGFIR